MQKILYTSFLFFLWCFVSWSQPQGILKVIPDQLEFRNIFNRITDVQFINIGNAPLTIANINYNKPELYFIRFDKYGNYPITIPPNDTVHMDCILAGYYFVSQQDSVDTMFVYNDGISTVEPIKIKIDFFEANQGLGSINGNIKVSSTNIPVSNAKIHFLLGGNYILNSTFSDVYGNYSAQLPPGNYIVAAEKDSFYTTFYGSKFDPFSSTAIHISKDSVSTANINITQMIQSSYSISGKIMDFISNRTVDKAVVVIRHGTHTPGKIKQPQDTLPTQSYSVFTDSYGGYNIQNIPQPGYYFVQSFSDFFIPAYFNQSGTSPVFWQQADSIEINTTLSNKNISMQRDSSTGGGIITGTITTGNTIPDKKIIIYAKSIDYNQPFNYALPIQGNSFAVNNLPYGRYQLIGQLIGYPDAIVDSLNITPIDTELSGITLNFNLTAIQTNPMIPTTVELYQNYPNPFNPTTKIQFSLPNSSIISLKIYNVLGQEIETLVNGLYNKGNHLLNWNAKNFTSGVYYYVLNYNGSRYSKKMLLIK
jgi:hypothetical protein